MKEGTVSIAAPPQKVFEYVRDVTRHPEWAAHQLTVTRNPGPAAGPGASYTTRAAMMGGVDGEVKVISEQAPSSFVIEAKDSAGVFRWSFLITPEGAGSRLTYRMEPVKMNPVMNILFALTWPFVGGPAYARTLNNLKARAEAAAATV